MEVKIIEKKGNEMKFLLSGVKAPFANSIRRAMIGEVPKFAIDEIKVYDNTSSLYDEQIALRLALIPLLSDNIDFYRLPEDCDCGGKGCPLCEVRLTLRAESPDEDGYTTVYSSDLSSNDPNVTPAHRRIPIVKLFSRRLKGAKGVIKQRIEIECIARLGKGKKHAKWQPVTACGYKNLPIIEIDHERCRNSCRKCIDICPKNILEIDGKLRVKENMDCIMCRLCEEVCEEKAIRIDVDEHTFIFSFESDGSLKTDEIIKEAVKILKEEYRKLIKEIEIEEGKK